MDVYKVNIADLVCSYCYCVFVGCFRMIVLKVFGPFAILVHHQLSRPFTLGFGMETHNMHDRAVSFPAHNRSKPGVNVQLFLLVVDKYQRILDYQFYLTCIVSIETTVKVENVCLTGCLTSLISFYEVWALSRWCQSYLRAWSIPLLLLQCLPLHRAGKLFEAVKSMLTSFYNLQLPSTDVVL